MSPAAGILDEALASVVARAIAPLADAVRDLTAQVEALRAAAPSRWLSVADTAERLGVDRQTVRAMAADGRLVSRRAGRRILIDSASIRPVSPAVVSRLAIEARR